MITSNIKCDAITLTTMLQFGNAWFHLTLYSRCDYLSMLRLKLINLKIILTYVVIQLLLMGLQSPVVAKISFTYYSYRSTAHKMCPTAAVIYTFNRLCVKIIVGYTDRSRGCLWQEKLYELRFSRSLRSEPGANCKFGRILWRELRNLRYCRLNYEYILINFWL